MAFYYRKYTLNCQSQETGRTNPVEENYSRGRPESTEQTEEIVLSDRSSELSEVDERGKYPGEI